MQPESIGNWNENQHQYHKRHLAYLNNQNLFQLKNQYWEEEMMHLNLYNFYKEKLLVDQLIPDLYTQLLN